MKSVLAVVLLILAGLFAQALPSTTFAEEPIDSTAPRITKEQIKEQIGKQGFVLLDCRPSEQWRASRQKLPGAVHEDPTDVASWAHKYPKDAKIVIY
jgi:hypothetical protein